MRHTFFKSGSIDAIKLPQYRPGQYGPWSLRKVSGKPYDIGYWTDYGPEPDDLYALGRDSTAWMSTSRMERESHLPHVRDAHGVVVVCGIGMGMYLNSVALRDEVTEVHAYDVSKDVIHMLTEATNFNQWPYRHKVHLHCLDVLRAQPTDFPAHIDHMYIDIWPDLGATDAIWNTRDIQRSACANTVGWWGMELDFFERCCAYPNTDQRLVASTYRRWAKELCLPLPSRDSEWCMLTKQVARLIFKKHYR
jgi:hypothetical protein